MQFYKITLAESSRRWLVSYGLAASVAVVTAVAPASSAAATAGDMRQDARPAVAPASERVTSTGAPARFTKGPCVFTTHGDWVHKTGNDATGHGWWVNGNCPGGTRATVKIWLEEYYSDGSWRVKGEGKKGPVYSGGGSANRANARSTCDNSSTASWRSRIDVDLIGIIDTPGQATTAVRDLACTVN